MILRVAFALLTIGCRQTCPPCRTPIVPPPQITVVRPPSCQLPDLPGPIAPSIAPSPGGIEMSRADFADMAVHILGMRDWIAAASACLEATR
jgi:hypothetical protein